MSGDKVAARTTMSLIYILSEEEQQTAYEEAEVYDLLAQQVLTPETYFWREGMEDWRPLSELPPMPGRAIIPSRRTEIPDTDQAMAQPQSLVEEPGSQSQNVERARRKKRKLAGRYYFKKNPVPLTVALQILMVGSLGATVYFIYLCFDKIYGWSTPDSITAILGTVDVSSANNSGVSPGDMTFFLHFIEILLCLHLLIEIMFLTWIYITNKNCRGFVSNMTYTPGWAVAYFFIPIVNFFRPCQVIQEIWKVSRNPRSWIGHRNSVLVGCWFAFRLSMLILARPFHTSYSDSDIPDVRALGTLLYMAVVEVNVVLVELTGLVLISVITWRHLKWVRQGP